jgi:hypothetical protein
MNQAMLNMAPEYAVRRADEPHCGHYALALAGNGDYIPCRKLPDFCSGCHDAFVAMVICEAEYVFKRADKSVWVCRIPADDDPARDRWHTAVGYRINKVQSTRSGAFVLQTDSETLVYATKGLWGGATGRMLKSRWTTVSTEAARRQVHEALGRGLVTRGEMFYRPRFFEWLVQIGVGEWGVPLLSAELAALERELAP